MTKITPIKTMDELAEYAGKNVRAKALLLGGQKPEPTAWYFEGKLMRAFFGDGFNYTSLKYIEQMAHLKEPCLILCPLLNTL